MENPTPESALVAGLTVLHIAAIAVAIVFLLVGLRLILKKQPANFTAFSGQAGSVMVSRRALQDLIKQACLLDDWVEAARPVVKLRKDQVHARVELRLARPDNLRDVTQRIQDRINALLQKSLSFEQIGEIQIVVKSFSETNEPAKSDPAPAPAPPSGAPPVDAP